MPNGFENGASAPKGDGNVGDTIGNRDSGESRLDSSQIFGFKELGQKGSDTAANDTADSTETTEAGQEGDKVKITDKAADQVDSFDNSDHAAGVSDHLNNASLLMDKIKGTDQEDNANKVRQEMGELMGESAAKITGDKSFGKSLGEAVGNGHYDVIKQAVGAATKK
ncbi:hypothetical protein GC174_00250 [bacterium]|nr:hypothetical protein [bacterium]